MRRYLGSPSSYNECAGRRANDPGTGQPLARGVVVPDATCSIAGCGGLHRARGLCAYHYNRSRLSGDLRPLDQVSPQERFWSKVDRAGPTPTHRPELGPCWVWTASLNSAGYGQFQWPRGRNNRAHRISYELLVGPIPDGLHLDHLCRVRQCVNPSHLEPVTLAENLRRGAAVITHCPQGHPYDEANTWHTKSGARVCRECKNARQRAWWKANRGNAS